MNYLLPADPWWLLRVPIAPGECIPFHLWMWWRFQFGTPQEINA